MIETTELRLELLQIVKDKNGSDVDEIIYNANKLFDWVNYDPTEIEQDVSPEPAQVYDKKPDLEDEQVIQNMILSNLLYFYKLNGSMDSATRSGSKLEYSVIPYYWSEDKQKMYKLLIDVINTRCIGNSGIEPVVKTSSDVIAEKQLKEEKRETLGRVVENYKKHHPDQDLVISEDCRKFNLKKAEEVDYDSMNFESKEDEDKWTAEFLERAKKLEEERSLVPKYSEEANKVADFYGLSDEIYDVTKPETRKWNCLTDPVIPETRIVI
jgi:hypothetical protein